METVTVWPFLAIVLQKPNLTKSNHETSTSILRLLRVVREKSPSHAGWCSQIIVGSSVVNGNIFFAPCQLSFLLLLLSIPEFYHITLTSASSSPPLLSAYKLPSISMRKMEDIRLKLLWLHFFSHSYAVTMNCMELTLPCLLSCSTFLESIPTFLGLQLTI